MVEEVAAPAIDAPDAAGGPVVDPAAARVAEAKVRADPIAQQHQLRIRAQLDRRVDPETAAQIVRVGHRITNAIYDQGSAVTQRAAEALQGASALSGSNTLVTHGTIERQGDRFVYRAEPSDRLVVPSEEGGTRTFTFETIEGDLSSFEAFFENDHRFVFAVQETDGDDLSISSERRGRLHDVTVRGDVVYEGETYNTDIRYRAEVTHEADSTGSERTRSATHTGTVRGDGMVLTVEERQTFHVVQAMRIDGLGGSATQQTRLIDNRLRVGEDEYRWNGVRTHQTFRDGVASNRNHEWAASGELLLNDAVLGTYRLGARDDVLAFELDFGTRRLPIDQFPR